MNLIHILSKESDALKITGLTSVVYFLLISNTSKDDDILWSEYTYGDLLDRLSKTFDEESVDESLDELVRKELIVEEEIDDITYFNIGTYVDRIKKLYIGVPVSLEDDFTDLIKLSEEFRAISRSGRSSTLAKRTNQEIIRLSKLSPNKYDIKTYMKLFTLCYECTHQECYREFQQKEFGQMKNFIKVYDNTSAIRIIITFSLNFETWCKSMSMGNLLYFKDDVYASIIGDVKKKKMRVDSEDESF